MRLCWVGLGSLLSVGCASGPCPCEAQSPAPPPCTSSSPAAVQTPAPSAANGDPRETRTQQVIASVIVQNRQRFRDCYEAERTKDPAAAGSLTLHFTIDPHGKVLQANVVEPRSTLKQPTLHQCALAALNAISFPPSSRGFESQVNYPFDFKPQ